MRRNNKNMKKNKKKIKDMKRKSKNNNLLDSLNCKRKENWNF